MSDEEINKAICDFIFVSEELQVFRQSFYKDYECRTPVKRELNYILDPSKIDYCNDLNAIRKAELWLLKVDDLSHDEYMCKLSEIHDKGIKITAKHRAEEFVKTIGKWKDNE
jgi:hypothetical protein